MQWYELMQRIQDVFNGTNLGIDTRLGLTISQNAGVTANGVVMIGRGQEQKDDDVHLKVTLYLEAWTKTGTKEFDKGYPQLVDLENKVDAILLAFRKACGELNEDVCVLDCGFQIVDLHVVNKVGDHDSIRPLLGTQYTIEARLFDLNEREDIY